AALMKSEGGGPFQAYANMALNNVIQALLLCGVLPTLVELRRALEIGLAPLVIKAITAYGRTVLDDFNAIAQARLRVAKDVEQQ
ncbi:conjugal transfer protein, partial [Pseudomonas aeruginosa]|nr:conjugal transfer protein [Pseudomonas aeruginosa]